jgi:hypothetical protein
MPQPSKNSTVDKVNQYITLIPPRKIRHSLPDTFLVLWLPWRRRLHAAQSWIFLLSCA